MRLFRRYSKTRRFRVGSAVREMLRARGVTLTALGRELGVSLTLVHQVVYGDRGRTPGASRRGRKARLVRAWIEGALGRDAGCLWPRLLPARFGRPTKARAKR
jgi:transcriptional regulator with XRE-family HTH domain